MDSRIMFIATFSKLVKSWNTFSSRDVFTENGNIFFFCGRFFFKIGNVEFIFEDAIETEVFEKWCT